MKNREIITAAVTAFVVCVALYLFLPSNLLRSAPTPEASVYEKVRKEKKLRAAYAVGAPLFLVDPNTKRKSGIFFDIVEKAAKQLGLVVEWTDEVGYGEMIQGLSQRRYDIVGSGVWLNADRGASADFSIPAYYDAVYAYVREGDKRFDKDLPILNSPQFTISTMDGELGAKIAKSDFPKASTTQLPQAADFTQMILNVVNKKADVVFLALAPAREYQAANPNKIRVVGTDPVRVFPVALLMRKGEYDLKQSLDAALTEMLTNGDIEAILLRYEKAPKSFLRTALPYRPTDLSK